MQLTPLLLWTGAAIALSPTIAHSIQLVASSPWTHYVVVAAVLLANCLRLDRGSRNATPHLAISTGVLAVAMVLQLVGIAGQSWSVAQVAIPLAAIGVALALGRPPLLPMALCFWLVPVPYFLATLTTPWAETMLANGAGSVASMFGADVAVSGPLIRSGGARFELESFQGGVITALVLAELGWYSSAAEGSASWTRAVARAALCASAVVVVQPAAVLLAVVILRWLGAEAAEAWMTVGVWLVAAFLGALLVEFRRSRRKALKAGLRRSGHGAASPADSD